MTGAEIRATFLDFFRARGHEVVGSSSLIPSNDPTLLFTNAGMVQFKSVFLGDERLPFRRAASSQKCLRAGGKHNDLENVGHTARHHTFFEMLGNFSFGDYFKREAIRFAWDLLTDVFRLPKERLWVSVYEEDDEAAALWADLTDVGKGKIVRLGAKDNFWQMGDTGPCGPCSEIIIDQGSEVGCGKSDCGVGCDCDRYLEIWNLVFMQYDRDKKGTLSPLPRPSIDTGMGLERMAAVLQGKHNNFDSDIFSPIIADICGFSRKSYGTDSATDTAIRVIADHIRAVSFLLAEGLAPSNEGKGYVLRRIIRRASRYAKSLDIEDPILYKLCESVSRSMGEAYPELIEEQSRVRKMLRMEEERFNRTLEQGLLLLNNIIRDLQQSGRNVIPGGDLFKLYDTFGFPIDIARDVAAENGLTIDEAGYHREMEIQKTKAKASWSVEEMGAAPVYKDLVEQHGKTEFTGYEETESESTVLALVVNGEAVAAINAGDGGEVLLDRTPFYAESGGQVGDTGELSSEGMKAVVLDTKKPVEGLHIHRVRVEEGLLRIGTAVLSQVDMRKRAATMRNHTATHLLHAALRNQLGGHVKQAGSYVSPERLRFDFTHFSPLGNETNEQLENQVDENIMKDIPVKTTVMETKKAIDAGVIALFGEKYGEKVRVLTISDVSSELCGGTHVAATGEIGLFKILSEGSVASGIRRIEAVTGWEAIRYFREKEKELGKISEFLKTSENPAEKVQKLLAEMRELERSMEKLKGRTASDVSAVILEKARDVAGIKVVASRLEGIEPKDLRVTADNVRAGIGSGILLLASVKDEQASMVAMVTKDLTDRYHAGNILKEVAAAAGGRGGGKPDIAQGGTKDIKKLDKALESLYDIVERR
jgi:alanyl-tRNA synthetase